MQELKLDLLALRDFSCLPPEAITAYIAGLNLSAGWGYDNRRTNVLGGLEKFLSREGRNRP